MGKRVLITRWRSAPSAPHSCNIQPATGPQDSSQNLRWSPPGDSWESRSFDPWWLHWWPKDGCTVHKNSGWDLMISRFFGQKENKEFKTRSKSAVCPFKTPSFAAIGPLVPWWLPWYRCCGCSSAQSDPIFWLAQLERSPSVGWIPILVDQNHHFSLGCRGFTSHPYLVTSRSCNSMAPKARSGRQQHPWHLQRRCQVVFQGLEIVGNTVYVHMLYIYIYIFLYVCMYIYIYSIYTHTTVRMWSAGIIRMCLEIRH